MKKLTLIFVVQLITFHVIAQIGAADFYKLKINVAANTNPQLAQFDINGYLKPFTNGIGLLRNSGSVLSWDNNTYATQSWVNSNFDNFGAWYFATNGTFYSAVASHYQLSFNNGNGISVSPSSVSGSGFALTTNLDINNMTEQTGTFSNNFQFPVYTSGAGGLNRRMSIINMESVLGTTSGTASRLVMRDGSANAYAHNFILSSDSTLKKNIMNLPNTEWTNKIKFKQFQFKDDHEEKIRYGVIAQDIEKLAPQLVSKDSEGKLAVSYIDMLIAKIAEMDKKINKLQNEILELKNP